MLREIEFEFCIERTNPTVWCAMTLYAKSDPGDTVPQDLLMVRVTHAGHTMFLCMYGVDDSPPGFIGVTQFPYDSGIAAYADVPLGVAW